MNDFHRNYLSLLSTQVKDEIAYLVNNGHNQDKIVVPCIFCVKHGHGYYFCRRLIDLRQFQSSLIGHEVHDQQLKKLSPQPDRREIGFTTHDIIQEPVTQLVPKTNYLPLLSVKL